MKEFDEKNVPDRPDIKEEPVVEPETASVEESVSEPETAASSAPQKDEEPAAEDVLGLKKSKKKASNRRLRYGGMAVLVTVLVIVGAVVLNIFANVLFDRFPLSLDMTSDDRFTVSQETIDVIKSIDKPVEIIAFFRETYLSQPNTGYAEFDTIYKQMKETWSQYELQSNGQVTIKYVDLTAQPTLVKEYEAYGDIAEGSILFRSGEGAEERARLKTLGDFYTYETDSYGYSLTSFTSQVEMMTASAIKAVISEEDLQVMLLTGHDEDSDAVTCLTDLYELNGYSVEQINLASQQEIGEKVTTAIIAAPEKDFADVEITRLRDWLTNDGKLGRNLMVVVNSLATSKDCPNLYEFLNDEYQIEVTDNLVVETDSNRAYAGYNAQVIYGDLPSSPIQTTAKESGVLSMMPRQILLKAGTDNTQSLFNISLVTFPESSRLVSLLDGENATQKQADEYPINGMGMAVKWTYDNSGDESVQVQTNVVVCGQDIVNSSVFQMQSVQNKKIMLDIMNYINGNEDSVTVPGKDITQTSTEFTAGTANVLGLVFALLLPVALLVICLVVFLRRRHL